MSWKAGNLFTRLKISKQPSVYLGQPGGERLIAEGRASFHSHRGVVSEHKITESCLGNSSRNISAVKHSPAAAAGHRSPHVCPGARVHPPPLQRVLANAQAEQALSLVLVPCTGPSHFWGENPLGDSSRAILRTGGGSGWCGVPAEAPRAAELML